MFALLALLAVLVVVAVLAVFGLLDMHFGCLRPLLDLLGMHFILEDWLQFGGLSNCPWHGMEPQLPEWPALRSGSTRSNVLFEEEGDLVLWGLRATDP